MISIDACRACGTNSLERLLDLGRTPLANALLSPEQVLQPEPTYPLNLAFCPGCSLVQILETVAPEELFSEYCYFSSFSDTMLAHVRQLSLSLIETRGLDAGSLVVEAASNDGYLLKNYKNAGVPVLGIEPAGNIARVAESRGIPTKQAFFCEALAKELAAENRKADVFHAHNVLAHVPDLPGFVRGVRHILKDDGLVVIEVPYVKNMLDLCEFDTIYHEHLSYFSLTALDRLFREHDLRVVDVRRIALHGGSLQLQVAPMAAGQSSHERVAALLAEEDGWGVSGGAAYRAFANRVETIRTDLRALLAGLKSKGARIAGYGASAKGATLLNYCGIGAEILDFIVDRSTVKQGRYTPGTHLLIEAPQRLIEAQPDYTLLLTWNFAEEIMAQQAEYLKRGGRFLLAIPHPHIM